MSSNPITSVAPSSSPITSVSQSSPRPLAHHANNNPAQFARLNLDLRGKIFPVDRETLMLLPESVLLGLFPQGLVLSKPATWEGGNDGIFAVDVCSLSIPMKKSIRADEEISLTQIVFNTYLNSGQKLNQISTVHLLNLDYSMPRKI